MKQWSKYLWMFLGAQALWLLAAIFWQVCVVDHHGEMAPNKSAYADINGGLKTALQMFRDDCGRYPSTAEGIEVLMNPPAEGSLTNWRGPYLEPKNVPKDPWGHEYVYRFPSTHNSNIYDLYSLGRDGVSRSGGNDADDIGNWQNSAPPIPTVVISRMEMVGSVSRLFFLSILFIPLLFGIRGIVGVFSKRIQILMSENPRADAVWGIISLVAMILWFLTIPALAGR